MKHLLCRSLAFALAQAVTPAAARPAMRDAGSANVEFEMMTWPEVKAALAAGKTTALVYTGGTEQRGPQNVNGGHNLMGRATVRAIAERLGDALALPVLPYTPNRASAEFPGTIGLRPETLEMVLEDITEQAIGSGFRNVVLMGDHGGGQSAGGVYEQVARRLDARHASQGVHVYYCDQVYAPANAEFDRRTLARGYPPGLHAGLSDTSEMLFLDPDGTWVRRGELSNAVGVPVDRDGQRRPQPGSPRNGITGDARRASRDLGRELFELKVSYAVAQIRGFIPAKSPAPPR